MPPSESTLKQYASRMAILQKAGVDGIADPEKLLKWFETEKHGASSQKLYLSAVKHSNPDKFPKVLQDKINELYKKQNEKDMEQKLTDKQEQNFVKWEDIVAVQKKLAALEDKSDSKWKQYLITSLYTLNAPVRADYGEMEVFNKYNKKRTGNELIWNKSPKFIFRVYKTAKTYGEVRIPLSKPLQKVVGEWFNHLGGVPKYLLGATPSSPNTLAVYIQDTMRKHTGKEVGVSLLRHSYITYMFPKLKTLKQKQDLSARMLHSRDLQEKYVSLKDVKD